MSPAVAVFAKWRGPGGEGCGVEGAQAEASEKLGSGGGISLFTKQLLASGNLGRGPIGK